PVDLDAVRGEKAHRRGKAPHSALRTDAGRQCEFLGFTHTVDDRGGDLRGSGAAAHADRLLRVEARLRTEFADLGSVPPLGRHADLTRVWVATDRDRVIGHAGLDAFEAADALGVLEHGQLAVHRQSIGWTYVDASPASDTRLITDLDDRGRCEHDKIVMPLLFYCQRWNSASLASALSKGSTDAGK